MDLHHGLNGFTTFHIVYLHYVTIFKHIKFLKFPNVIIVWFADFTEFKSNWTIANHSQR